MGEIVIHQPPGLTISYFPSLTPITGSIKAAILLQQVIYLTKRGHGHDHWITKEGGQQEWIKDTGLTLKEFNLALKALESRRLIEHDYDRRNHQLRIRLLIERYNKAVDEIPPDDPAPKHVPKRHMTKRHMPKGNMPSNSAIDSDTSHVTLATEDEHVTKEHMPKGQMVGEHMTKEHMPKGHFVCSKDLESLKTKKETPPISPSPASADEVTGSDSPAGKFVAWWNEHIVPLGGRPFSLEDADPKFITKANKALKAKSSRGFWERVKQGFEASEWLQGKIPPTPGKKRFKASLPWLLSLHHTKGMANYTLVAENEWADDTTPAHRISKFQE